MKDETTYGLSPEQLARLLAIGVENEEDQVHAHPGRTATEALEGLLTGEKLLDPANPDSPPVVLQRACDQLLAAAGQTIGELLLNSRTDLVVIEYLKDYGKELVRRGRSGAKQAAATAIYYTAIASALVFHGQKITRHSSEKLHEAHMVLKRKPWIPAELGGMFRKAAVVCQQRQKSTVTIPEVQYGLSK